MLYPLELRVGVLGFTDRVWRANGVQWVVSPRGSAFDPFDGR